MSIKQNNISGWFDIHDAGFIRQQVGRDPREIVRELVQNAFDADGATAITADLTYDPKTAAVTVVVEDDGVGFKTLDEAFTIFLSGKFDDPRKRGRKGRGLKEAIAVCHTATVEALGKTAVFATEGRTRCRTTKGNNRTRGTRVAMTIRRWNQRDIAPIVENLRAFDPPAGASFTVNGLAVEAHAIVATVSARLQTLIIEEDTDKYTTRDTQVTLLRPRHGEKPHVYEMGLPVCDVDTPWHLNVQQRMPIPDHRSTVSPTWLRKLKVQVLDNMGKVMTEGEMKADWVGGVLAETREEVKDTYIKRVFGTKIAIRTPGRSDDNTAAEEDMGLNVIDSRHLPKGIRDTLRERVPSTVEVVREAKAVEAKRGWKVVNVTETEGEQAVCRLAAWIANTVSGVSDVTAHIDLDIILPTGQAAAACWKPQQSSIAFSRPRLGPAFFEDPFSARVLGIIIHEVSHIGQAAYGHGPEFQKRLEVVAGEVAHLLLVRGKEARRVASGQPFLP